MRSRTNRVLKGGVGGKVRGSGEREGGKGGEREVLLTIKREAEGLGNALDPGTPVIEYRP